MTREHRLHKHWSLKAPYLGYRYLLLRMPLKHTQDLARVDASPYPYGPCARNDHGQAGPCYYLSALSILHRWTGMCLEVEEPR